MLSRKTRSRSIVYWLGSNLYLNITNKCSNDCYFCLRKFRKGVGGFNLLLKKDPSTKEVIFELQKVINKKNWIEIVFCGFGEPFNRLDCLLEVTKWIRRYYGKPVRIRVDTNGQGYLLNNSRNVVKELKDAGVDKISVSLNGHSKETYAAVCRPELEDAFESVLKFIEKAYGNFEVEVTTVAIPEVEHSKVKEIAERLRAGFRIREYIPCSW